MANPIFITESGDGDADSTSYVTLIFADAYADTFFSLADYTAWALLTDAVKERFLNQGTMYVNNNYQFEGEISVSTQALQFPRNYAYNCLSELITGVPTEIEQATVLALKKLMNEVELQPDLDRGGAIKSERVDVIAISYFQGASSYTKFVEIERLLSNACYVLGNKNSNANITLIQA